MAFRDTYEIREFIETVTEFGQTGEVFEAAVRQCRSDKAVLVLAESDPLSRQLGMLALLVQQNVPLAAAGHSDLNNVLEPLFTGTRAGVCSKVTKPKVRKKSPRDKGLGNPDLATARVTSVTVRKKNADAFASKYVHQVLEWRDRGDTLAKIAARLNDMNLPGRRGGKWHSTSVRNLIERCKLLT
ncbi:recombinase family protein [Diaphorobacter aerolatus]|uniref:Recombinase family protein n=1 Tax=Diaphorobacter aerolatus TaxID=1288495 RepID=A0A7H0GPW0_9BURK|nr:recombinase family protein [Diaphorobacter aerolatus]QNP50326.1 recombinase family protein [Diaphorobacter aerolatus]